MSKDGQNQQHTQTVFSRFTRLESELDCLLLAVKNMLAYYREFHPDFPVNPGEDADDDEDQKKAAKDELKILAGHRSRFGGNFSQLEARHFIEQQKSYHREIQFQGLTTLTTKTSMDGCHALYLSYQNGPSGTILEKRFGLMI